MKVYAKIRQNGEYHSQNISQAVYGFREMGAEIVRYQKISDIYESVTKEDIVLDYITQVEMILKKFGVVPACEDYPVECQKYFTSSPNSNILVLLEEISWRKKEKKQKRKFYGNFLFQLYI